MTFVQAADDRNRDRSRKWYLLLLLLLLFVMSTGVFLYLIRQGAAPRAALPDVLGLEGKKPPRFGQAIGPVARPLDVAVSPDGKLVYTAEGAGEYALRVFDAETGELVNTGTPPHTTQFNRQPKEIAVAADGTVYVADRALRQVLIFNADGSFRDTLRPAGVDVWVPVSVAVGPDGLIYVSEVMGGLLPRHRIYALQPDGVVVREFGQAGLAESDLLYPAHIAVDSLGRVWVADTTGVKAFASDGAYLFRLPGEGAQGVALTGGLTYVDGRLYVTDVTNHRVLVFDVSGDAPSYLFQFGQLGVGKGGLRYPAGIAVQAGRVYIANRENSRIDIWTY